MIWSINSVCDTEIINKSRTRNYDLKTRRKKSRVIFSLDSILSIFFVLSALIFLFVRPSSSFGADFLCNRIPGLTAKQRVICETWPDALAAIGDGTKLAIAECQHQFKFSRWNCTPVQSDHTFGHVQVVGSKEAAFLYAINSAGITYQISKACSKGNITSCGCALPTTISNNKFRSTEEEFAKKSNSVVNSNWRWGGCSADIDYAIRLSRKFLDSREVESDSRSLMNLHNNKAGRKVVQATLETECKCHGVSGSCTLKTCWLKLTNFRRIGDQLIEKYRGAKVVLAKYKNIESQSNVIRTKRFRSAEKDTMNPQDNSISQSAGPLPGKSENNFVLVVKSNKSPLMGYHFEAKPWLNMDSQSGQGHSPPKRTDLVFLAPSPSYCEHNSTIGSLGTRGRRCFLDKKSSNDESSCSILCCGRGYNTHQIIRRWKCNCKFKWCCDVVCSDCSELVQVFTCN